MGKATILGHLGGARYSVSVHQDETRIDDMIQAATDLIAQLAPERDAAQADYDQAVADYEQALAERDTDIQVIPPGDIVPDDLARAINKKTTEISLWFDTVSKAEVRLSNIKARQLNLEKRIEWLQTLYNIDPLPTTAYCLDLSDGADGRPALSGDVGTVEPFHRADDVRLICGNTAAYRADPAYSQALDGEIVPVAAMSPAAFVYNYAMWPGLNAWRPKYHVGIITAKAAPYGPVDVEIAAPPHLDSDDFSRTHAGIPVQYMDCDARAFLVGDRVVVAYDANNTNPRVVGFAQAPRECPLAKDFLVQDLSDASYWRLSPDENGDWSLAPSSKIAGPCVWMGRANKLVSCHYLDHKVYASGVGYTLPTVNYNGQSSVDPIYPFMAGYNPAGDLVCIGAFFAFVRFAGPLSIPRYKFMISAFRYSGGSWIRDMDIWDDGSESGYSGYVTITEAGYWRAELSPTGDKVLVMSCSGTSASTWTRYIYDLDWTAKTATANGTFVTPNKSFGATAVRTEEFMPEEETGAGFDYTRINWDLKTSGYTENLPIYFAFTADGELIPFDAKGELSIDWHGQDDLGTWSGYVTADATWKPDFWGADVFRSAITMDFVDSLPNSVTAFQTAGDYGLGAANITAFNPWSRVGVVSFQNSIWPGEDGHLRAVGGDGASVAVQGCSVVANGAIVYSLGSSDLGVQSDALTFGHLSSSTPSPPLAKVTGSTLTISPQCPVPLVAPPGWSAGGSTSYSYSPEGYMFAGADMAGNVVVLDRHTVGGQRVQHLSGTPSLATLFDGFDLDGLRLVGMI